MGRHPLSDGGGTRNPNRTRDSRIWNEDLSAAEDRLGVTTFFINGKVHRGSLTIEELDKQLQPLLKS